MIIIKSVIFLATVAGVVAFSLAPLFLKGLPALAKNARSSSTAVVDVRSSFSFSGQGVTRGVALMAYKCATCNGEFKSEGASRQHLRDKHNLHGCLECDKFFNSDGSLAQHTKSVHTPGDRGQGNAGGRGQGNALMVCKCATCNGEFMSEGALRQHLRDKHNLHGCLEYNKFFNSDGSLAQHTKSVHTPGDRGQGNTGGWPSTNPNPSGGDRSNKPPGGSKRLAVDRRSPVYYRQTSVDDDDWW